MRLTRRAALLGVGASLLPLRVAAEDRALYLASCRLRSGQMAAAIVDEAGDILLTEPIDARGHGGALCPDGDHAVLFARRPGRFAIVFDVARRERVCAFAPPAGRRFAGHGAYSADGRLLYAAENDFEAERGVIGIYDARDGYLRRGEFDTHGIGPHEILALRDGNTLAVANGGIATHPGFARMKLNLPTMRPSLVLLRARDGTLLAKAELPSALHKVSIRHMAEAGAGQLWFGAQYEGPAEDTVPLVGTFDDRRGLCLVEAPDSAFAALNQYVGSVAASRDGATVVTTSPRGSIALVWDVATRTLRARHALADVCGAAPHGRQGLLLTTGLGNVLPLGATGGRASVAWDNHVLAL